MAFEKGVEEKGNATYTTDTEADVDHDASSSVRSRPRSIVSNGSVSSHSSGSGSGGGGPDKTRSRLRTRSFSFEGSRPPVEGEGNGRNSFNSTRSRPRSRDASPRPSSQRAPPFAERKPPSGDQNSAKKVVELDRDRPGDWVIHHHRSNLVIELRERDVGGFSSAFRAFWGGVRRMGGGRKETLLPSSAVPSTSKDEKRFQVNFAEVQRMKIRKLQCQLVRHVVEMRTKGSESPGWEEALEQYIKALQDHDYMENRSRSVRDPFLATGEYAIDNYVLNCNIDGTLARDGDLRHAYSPRPWEGLDPGGRDHEPICGTRGSNVARTWLRGFKERVVLAAAGGAFLIGPMWLMVLNRGLYTSLVSTTAFVAGFGLLMAYFLDEGKDVLAGTAAYAAVLVVFIGTSGT